MGDSITHLPCTNNYDLFNIYEFYSHLGGQLAFKSGPPIYVIIRTFMYAVPLIS